MFHDLAHGDEVEIRFGKLHCLNLSQIALMSLLHDARIGFLIHLKTVGIPAKLLEEVEVLSGTSSDVQGATLR